MLEKMIRSQTAKQEQQLESFLARHDAANPFPEDVLLTADADYTPPVKNKPQSREWC